MTSLINPETENNVQPDLSPRTQFDPQLLPGSDTAAPAVAANHGRQMLIEDDGAVITAMTYAGASPRLVIWRGRTLVAEHRLTGKPSAPVMVDVPGQGISVWLSVDNELYRCSLLDESPSLVKGIRGLLLDVAAGPSGQTWLAVSRGGPLNFNIFENGQINQTMAVGVNAATANIVFDTSGRLHLAAEVDQGIRYRRYDSLDEQLIPDVDEVAAEPYGSSPVLSVLPDGRVLFAYLGESCRETGDKRWNVSWQRLGHGGYIGALVRRTDGTWHREHLADSKQIVMRHRPNNEAYGGGPSDDLRIRIEEYSPPALVVDSAGVPQVIWSNLDRRWVYASRFVDSQFTPAVEIRGPFEGLSGPCLVSRTIPAERETHLPFAVITSGRTYLDELVLPATTVDGERQIDFLQFDEIAAQSGLEQFVNTLRRRPENPVIAKGDPGGFDDAGIVADIWRDGNRWSAEYLARNRDSTSREFSPMGLAESADGINWIKHPPKPSAERYSVDGSTNHRYNVRYIKDPDEPNPEHRYKGLYRVDDLGPWAWAVVVSSDGKEWKRVDTGHVIRADDDVRLWIDNDDISERRWKATAIGRSYCGRVCLMWYSSDGVHWQGERDTLDLDDPYGSPPDKFGTGRILIDAWAGPDEEDELHGGYVFREGDRWLCHYMKWTPDGHIYCGMATSRDGVNFSRVAGGAVTLPLGEPGTWDAGRVAIREAPFRVGDVWRQYYTGCGWKHGLGGIGAKTSPWGINCPNQMGAAEIEVGRWAGLQLSRDSEAGELTTVPLAPTKPMALTINVDGLARADSTLTVQVLDASTGEPIAGYGTADCQLEPVDGLAVSVRWSEHATLPTTAIRLNVKISGWGVRLYGLTLHPSDAVK